MDNDKQWLKHVDRVRLLLGIVLTASILLFFTLILWIKGGIDPYSVASKTAIQHAEKKADMFWHAPDISIVTDAKRRERIEYGRELIAHTAKYLGPQGSVADISNGLNCQNCHLDAGTKPFGNNYGAVAATYPKYRARSGSVESLEKRVNDCFERSLNGKPLDTASREMEAIVSYIQFIGSGVDPSSIPPGIGMKKIQLLDRAASPAKGKELYENQCAVCHGMNGEGRKQSLAGEYQFPPLWGEHSYNNGAGLYRLSNFAQFIHSNMPLGAAFDSPVLTEEEAWDIAAYVNSLPRPVKDLSKDWPNLETKPFDHPFGPFADPYPEHQHKFGPFKEIQAFYTKREKQ